MGHSGYGQQPRTVELRTAPGRYEVFLVPNQDWLKGQNALTANHGEKLAPYAKGVAPVTLRLLAYEYVLVARDDKGTIRYTPFVPRQNTAVTVDFGPAVGGTPAGETR